jgi:phosphatidylinositol alpha-mannosyltransferase
MRIGLVCPYNIFKNGGVQECVLALKHHYALLGHEAYIITPRPHGIKTKEQDGIILLGQSRDVKSPFHTTAQVSVAFDSTNIDNMLKTHNFDVLHFHEPWVPIVSRQILLRSNTVNIATFHAKLPETMMSKTIEKVVTPYTKSILKYINAFTAVSDAGAEYISTICDEPITIIPNGIDLSKFADSLIHKRKDNTILYIGRLERRKGVIYLLRAFKLLLSKLPNAKLIVVGDGPDKQKLKQYVKENHLSNVEFLGFVSEETKINLLKEATIYCSPAIYGESFGIVLLEAMATGTVTVAGNNPGYANVLKDRGAISLVNVKDTEEFARRLILLMTDNGIRNLWNSWAGDTIKEYDYQIVAKKYLDLYKHTLSAHIK